MRSERSAAYHLGLIGYPLGHSLSPQLHQAALSAAGLAGDYGLFPIPPGEPGMKAMLELARRLQENDLHGLNVTIPHKQVMMGMVDELSEVSRAVGAVNTLYRIPGGQLAGDNTDVPGFLRDVRRIMGGTGPGQALVLGAGGSARAVVYALGLAGWQVRVLARREEQAAGLVGELRPALQGENRLFPGLLTKKALSLARDVDLLVNTTPLGMYPHGEGCPWPADVPLPARGAVYDLVYNPPETLLLRMARAAGLVAASGAGMLIAQAALSFQRWTGVEAPYAVMEKAFQEAQKIQTGVT